MSNELEVMSRLFTGGNIAVNDLKQQKEILQNKVNTIIEEKAIVNYGAIDKAKVEAELMKDFLVPLGPNPKDRAYSSLNYFQANGMFEFVMNRGGQNTSKFSMHNHALGQMAERYTIPARYMRDLVTHGDWGRALAAETFNTHIINKDPTKFLFRTIKDQVRGVLSDKYRRINAKRLFDRFFEASAKLGLVVYDAHYDETKVWIEAIYPEVMVFNTPRNGVQVVNFGVRLSTSDFGDGALEMRFFMMKCWCVNGAVSNSAMRRIHSGKRIPDDMRVSDNTAYHDTEFHAGLVYDSMLDILEVPNIQSKIAGLQKASDNKIEFDAMMKGLPKRGMLKEEIVELTSVVTNGSYDDGVEGENTMYKLSQGISAIARDKDGRRKRELQELAGQLIFN
jgi:hypothetical protein